MIESAPLEGTAFTGCGKTQGPSLLWPTTEPSLPQSRSAGRNKIAEHGAEGGMLGRLVFTDSGAGFSRRHTVCILSAVILSVVRLPLAAAEQVKIFECELAVL